MSRNTDFNISDAARTLQEAITKSYRRYGVHIDKADEEAFDVTSLLTWTMVHRAFIDALNTTVLLQLHPSENSDIFQMECTLHKVKPGYSVPENVTNAWIEDEYRFYDIESKLKARFGDDAVSVSPIQVHARPHEPGRMDGDDCVKIVSLDVSKVLAQEGLIDRWVDEAWSWEVPSMREMAQKESGTRLYTTSGMAYHWKMIAGYLFSKPGRYSYDETFNVDVQTVLSELQSAAKAEREAGGRTQPSSVENSLEILGGLLDTVITSKNDYNSSAALYAAAEALRVGLSAIRLDPANMKSNEMKLASFIINQYDNLHQDPSLSAYKKGLYEDIQRYIDALNARGVFLNSPDAMQIRASQEETLANARADLEGMLGAFQKMRTSGETHSMFMADLRRHMGTLFAEAHTPDLKRAQIPPHVKQANQVTQLV